MKGYLIDPMAHTITEVDYTGDYKQIYGLIECAPSPFDVVRLANGDTVFVDDEGLLKSPEFFFTIAGFPHPLANKGLVLGCDDEGETVEVKSTLDELTKLIGWKRQTVLGFVDYSEPTTLLGRPATRFVRETVYGPPKDDGEPT